MVWGILFWKLYGCIYALGVSVEVDDRVRWILLASFSAKFRMRSPIRNTFAPIKIFRKRGFARSVPRRRACPMTAA